jgi:hypothetical protein
LHRILKKGLNCRRYQNYNRSNWEAVILNGISI